MFPANSMDPREHVAWHVARMRQGVGEPPSPHGAAGAELKTILRNWLGIEADAGCGCDAMASRMDALGPDWCEGPGLAEIVKTMQGEHAKRWADGRTRLPWSDLAARQLVKLACRRARQNASNNTP